MKHFIILSQVEYFQSIDCSNCKQIVTEKFEPEDRLMTLHEFSLYIMRIMKLHQDKADVKTRARSGKDINQIGNILELDELAPNIQ